MPLEATDRAGCARNHAYHHRAIWLDRQARHAPAVSPHQQRVDVHGRAPPAASLLAIYIDRKTFIKSAAGEPRSAFAVAIDMTSALLRMIALLVGSVMA